MEDFYDAHKRHYEDAEVLYKDGRWGNAEHLYGLSAECGIKTLLQASGQTPPRRHLDLLLFDNQYRNLCRAYEFRRHGRGQISLELPSKVREGFDGWRIEQRYFHRDAFDEQSATRRRQGARAMRGLVTKAKEKGWL